ncbi:MAG: OmpH family outer membrane protein [Acetobacteraceae bacterium]
MFHIPLDTARRMIARFSLTLALAAWPLAGQAQGQSGGNGWFVPQPPRPAAPPAGAANPPTGQPEAAPPPSEDVMPMMEPPQGPLPPLQVQLPPMPEIPPIPKGSATPAAIVGILSVPDILRVSTAYQQADKELSARRTKLNEDGQKEQNALRELGQNFANERAKLTPEQIRSREKQYADQVNDARRKFSERARVIQEAGQYVMAQIERVIEQVAQQVAASRGVNLVLNRAQVLGTTADFDLTPQVADVLNKILPSVVIPPDGISPNDFKAPIAGPRANATPEVTPAAAPASPAAKATPAPAAAKPGPGAKPPPAGKH